MDIIRVSMLGMCGVIMGFFLKGTRAEYTAFITMGIGIMILGLAVGKLEYLFQTLGNLQNSLEHSDPSGTARDDSGVSGMKRLEAREVQCFRGEYREKRYGGARREKGKNRYVIWLLFLLTFLLVLPSVFVRAETGQITEKTNTNLQPDTV